MDDLELFFLEQMKNPEFKAEHEISRTEFAVTRALVEARIACNMTQRELALKTGIRQSNISRIENGACSPTIATLAVLAMGLGKELEISFK